jgi:hypothetical protein
MLLRDRREMTEALAQGLSDSPDLVTLIRLGARNAGGRSFEAITRNLARRTDLHAMRLEDLTPHYVETLRRWRPNFTAQADELAERGYDQRFRRLWTLYLAYCEAGFAERRICDVQLLLTKPRSRIVSRRYRKRSDHSQHPDLSLGAGSTRCSTTSSTVPWLPASRTSAIGSAAADGARPG